MAHGYIYKTTIDNVDSSLHKHFYIGQHRKEYFDINYFGSGVKIRDYIKKWGTDSLSVEILEWGYSSEDMNNLEAKYVDENLNTEMCLNLVSGGRYSTWSLESRKKASMNMLGMKNHRYGTHHTDEWKNLASIRGKQFRHSEETKRRIRDSRIKLGNSFYSPEVRKKMSDKAKITRNATGYKWTDEQILAHKSRLILSKSKKRKIQNEELPIIEKMLHSGKSQYDIAKIYNVTPHTIYWINLTRIPRLKIIKPEIFE